MSRYMAVDSAALLEIAGVDACCRVKSLCSILHSTCFPLPDLSPSLTSQPTKDLETLVIRRDKVFSSAKLLFNQIIAFGRHPSSSGAHMMEQTKWGNGEQVCLHVQTFYLVTFHSHASKKQLLAHAKRFPLHDPTSL